MINLATSLGITALYLLDFVGIVGAQEDNAYLRRITLPGHRSLELEQKESELVTNSRRKLRRLHLEATGKELTEENIDAAIDKARTEATGRWEEEYERTFVQNFTNIGEHQVHTSKKGRRWTQVVASKDGILISGLSPGWPHNTGRNEFYCVGIDDIGHNNLPDQKTKLVLLDCRKTFKEQIGLTYKDKEIIFNELDGVFWDWCATASNARKSKIFVNQCDFVDPFQVWSLLTDDNTWRPDVDKTKCVSAKPPSAGRSGGGRLKLATCSKNEKKREAQVFIYCEQKTKCEFDTVTDKIKLDCKIQDECTQYTNTIK